MFQDFDSLTPEAGAEDCHCLPGVYTTETRRVISHPAGHHPAGIPGSDVQSADRLRSPQLSPATDELQWRCVCVCEKKEIFISVFMRKCVMFNAYAPIHLLLLCCKTGLFFIPPRTLHRCWDACLCIAIVRKCHCWHLTGTRAPTQACLLATCGPTSSAADTGPLVCSPSIPLRSPAQSACLVALGLWEINQVSTIAFIGVFLTGSPEEKELPCSCTGPAELPEKTQS